MRVWAPIFALFILWADVSLAKDEQKRAIPELTRVTMLYGRTPRVPGNAWAYLHYGVKNPSKIPADLTLVLTPKGQRNVTIYRHRFTLEPGCSYTFRTPITVGTVEDYTVEMYYGGNLLEAEDFPVRLAAPFRRIIWFVNDNIDLEYGSFTKNEHLNAKYSNAFTAARDTPTHWSGFDRAHALIFFQPDYAAMTTRQINAVLDYVSRGGTLIFADPNGIAEAMDTPFRKLLPLTPLRIRKIDVFDSLKTIGGKRVVWEDGADFLESVTRGDGVTSLSQGDYPVVRWTSYGLGTIGACAINPSLRAMRSSNNFNTYWKHLLRHGGKVGFASSVASRELTKSLDAMTGLEIPKPNTIRQILVGYVVVVFVVLGLGIVLRRRIVSWVVLAVVALVGTGWIFVYAGQRNSAMASDLATLIEFSVAGTDEGTSEQMISLFTKDEQTVDIDGGGVDTRLRAVIPPKVKKKAAQQSRGAPDAGPGGAKKDGKKKGKLRETYSQSGKDETVRDPLKVNSQNGISSLKGLLLRQFASKFYSSLVITPQQAYKQLPEVQWTAEGAVMPAWQYPDGDFVYAFLLCEAGAIALTVDGRELSLDQRQGIAPPEVLAPEIESLRNFLLEHAMPAPCIAVFEDVQGSETANTPEGFTVMGKRVRVVPVRQRLEEAIWIQPERIRVDANKGASRMLKTDGEWREVNQRSGSNLYGLSASLPRGLNALQVDEVAVEFVGDNRGRNIRFSILLKTPGGKKKELKGIEATRVEGNTYYFSGPDVQSLIDPSDGHFEVILKSEVITFIKDPIDAMRVNRWTIQKLNVGVRGKLAAEYRGTL